MSVTSNGNAMRIDPTAGPGDSSRKNTAVEHACELAQQHVNSTVLEPVSSAYTDVSAALLASPATELVLVAGYKNSASFCKHTLPAQQIIKGAAEARLLINETAAQSFSGPRGMHYLAQAGAGEGKDFQAAPGVFVAKLYKPDVVLCKMAAVGLDFFACTPNKSKYAYPYKYVLLPVTQPCHFVQTLYDMRGLPAGIGWLLQWQLTGPKNSKMEYTFFADPPDGAILPTIRVKVGDKSFAIVPEPTRHAAPKFTLLAMTCWECGDRAHICQHRPFAHAPGTAHS